MAISGPSRSSRDGWTMTLPETEVLDSFLTHPGSDRIGARAREQLVHQWADHAVVLVSGLGHVPNADRVPLQQYPTQLPLRLSRSVTVSRASGVPRVRVG